MPLIFALWPDEPIRQTLARQRLHFAKAAGGRATRPATLHVTLSYSKQDQDADRFMDIGHGVSLATFDLTLNVADYSEYAKIAWVGSKCPPSALFDLHGQLQRAILAAGCEPDLRTFRPHITVARDVTIPFKPVSIAPVKWPVSHFSLVITRRTAFNIVYEVLHTWPLATSPSAVPTALAGA